MRKIFLRPKSQNAAGAKTASPAVAKPGPRPGPRPAVSPKSDSSKADVLAAFRQSKAIATQQQREYEASKERPFGFSVPHDQDREIILLDREPYRLYLHEWQDQSTKRFHTEVCVKDGGLCPVCDKLGKQGVHTIIFTGVEVNPRMVHPDDKDRAKGAQRYVPLVDKQGKLVKYMRRLFVLKPNPAVRVMREFEMNGDGKRGFHGFRLKCFRGPDPKAPRVGDDFRFVAYVGDEQLAKLPKLTGIENIATIVNYDKAYPRPSEKELRTRYGVGGPPGSEDIDDDSTPWGEEEGIV